MKIALLVLTVAAGARASVKSAGTDACAIARGGAPDSVYAQELKCRAEWLKTVLTAMPEDVNAGRIADNGQRIAFVVKRLEAAWKRKVKEHPPGASAASGDCAQANKTAPDDAYVEELVCEANWFGTILSLPHYRTDAESVAFFRRRIVDVDRRLEAAWKHKKRDSEREHAR